MTKDQIEQMLGEMGIPFRYHHFTQKEMQDIMKQEKDSQRMLEEAFRGIGYGID